MCSRHFIESDYKVDSKDTNPRRKKNRSTDELQRKRLCPDAFPSDFSDLPEYYSKKVPERRSESTSRAARHQKECEAVELASQEILDADKVASLDEIEEKLVLETNFPKETVLQRDVNKLTFYSLTENDLGRPSVKYSLIIAKDLQFTLWCREVKIPISKVAQFCNKGHKIDSWAGVLNILAFLKNIAEQRLSDLFSLEVFFSLFGGIWIWIWASKNVNIQSWVIIF